MTLAKNLDIRVQDFNSIASDAIFIKNLRRLTLDYFSGMNHELNNLLKLSKTQQVKCKIITAYAKGEMVAWALLSKEASDFRFARTATNFDPNTGILFQIYVKWTHRRQGIGSEILKIARRKAGPYQLCFCPWDVTSDKFYKKFGHYKHKML